jgi:predicted acetyltransferase
MNIEIIPASLEQQPILGNLLALYLHDFTEFLPNDVDDDGRFRYDRLPLYWTEPQRHPHLVRVDGKWAGFALVRQVSHFTGDEDVADMTEFFILRGYRRRGVGGVAARRVFDLFPGKWEVRVVRANEPAQAFWRRTVDEHTGGAFEERWCDDEKWKGLALSFVAANGG